jgi:hypothetical protein
MSVAGIISVGVGVSVGLRDGVFVSVGGFGVAVGVVETVYVNFGEAKNA